MTALAVGSLLVYPAQKALAIFEWNASLFATPKPGLGSKVIDLSWGTSYGPLCSPERLMVRYNKGSTPPNPAYKDGTLLGYFDTDENDTTHQLVHAATDYAYTIYACEGPTCSVLCDITNESDAVTTENEQWLVQSVRDYDLDTDVRILDPDVWWKQADPELHRHSFGAHQGEVGVFFHGDDDDVDKPEGVWVLHSADTTWESDWNDPSAWGSTTMVASTTTSGEYDGPKNLMVVPTQDASSNSRLRLFWTSADGQEPTYYTLNSALAVDADGDDYGLCCADSGDCSSTSTCSLGDFDEVCCDFEDNGADVRLEYTALDGNCLAMVGWHGHDLWDDLGPVWDPTTDELALLFSGDPSTTGACDDCTVPPMEGQADVDMWFWDTGGGCDSGDPDTAAKFCLAEVDGDTGDTDSSWCPDQMVSDAHDPFSVSYPDEKKVYWKVGHSAWMVGYTSDNGRTFEDESEIDFYFEDEDPYDTGMDTDDVLDPGCVEDPASIIWKAGPFARELMVFLTRTAKRGAFAEDAFRCFSTQDTGVVPDDPEFEEYPGLVSAVLWNG